MEAMTARAAPATGLRKNVQMASGTHESGKGKLTGATINKIKQMFGTAQNRESQPKTLALS
jgi:hypothetical protein